MFTPQPRLTTFRTFEAWFAGLLLGCSLLAIGAGLWFFRHYDGRFYQGITIDGYDVSGLTKEEVRAYLAKTVTTPPDFTISLAVDDIEVSSTSAQLGARYATNQSLDKAYSIGRTGSLFKRIWTIIHTRTQPVAFTSEVIYQEAAAQELVTLLAQKVNIIGEEPMARLGYANSPASLVIHPGKPGRAVKEVDAIEHIYSSQTKTDAHIPIAVASTAAQLTEEQQVLARERALKLVGQQILFVADKENVSRTLKDEELITFLALPEGYQESLIRNTIATWSATLNRPAQDAEFDYNKETLVVTHFKPHRNGLILDEGTTYDQLLTRLSELETRTAEPEVAAEPTKPLTFVVTKTEPTTTLAKTNDLGIQELIGFGDSEYDHSIPTRVHNVAHTAKKINLLIIPPEQEFSFNKALGEVSRATGFQPAYVIKNGRTELGDGGGVCQVSTTLFRAVLNAGLPITKRKAHSYRVSYYELNAKPGIDATVYAGDVDLRFKNDTGHHILLYTETNSDDLYMKVELYGTSDGRTAEIVDHEVWDARPAPATVFIPDPSLPPGTRRQIDWSVGGVKAKFKNIVKDKNGNLIREEEYYSNYVPWSAKYLVGV